MSLTYHEDELAIARDASHPSHVLPPALPQSAYVLDVGCGAGQTLIAAYPEHLSFGLDRDYEALTLGRSWTPYVRFVCSNAEAIPFRAGVFDAVVARVSLAYTDLSRSLPEIRRVLKEGGLLWIVLHPPAIPWQTARDGGWKAWLFFVYISANSLLFHAFGRMFPFFGRRYESFQTSGGVERALCKSGFVNVQIERGRHFVVTAHAG